MPADADIVSDTGDSRSQPQYQAADHAGDNNPPIHIFGGDPGGDTFMLCAHPLLGYYPACDKRLYDCL